MKFNEIVRKIQLFLFSFQYVCNLISTRYDCYMGTLNVLCQSYQLITLQEPITHKMPFKKGIVVIFLLFFKANHRESINHINDVNGSFLSPMHSRTTFNDLEIDFISIVLTGGGYNGKHI
jgi:hypothetical protein